MHARSAATKRLHGEGEQSFYNWLEENPASLSATKKMTSSLNDLERVVRNRDDYFQAGFPQDIDYAKHVIDPALRDAVNEVKDTLLPRHNVDTTLITDIVHYTSLQALFSMLYGRIEPSDLSEVAPPNRATTDHRFLRLYDSANLNDPSEGAYFLKRCTKAYHVVRVPAYIASFITPNETAQNSVNGTRDNLVFWRHYGKEGRGCSISIPADRFASARFDLTLNTVTYGSQEADNDADKIRSVLRYLDPIISKTARLDLRRQVAATILESLGEIPYLYKSSAYRYEKECRIVALESGLKSHGGIRYDFEERPGESGRLRMYGQHPCLEFTNILSTGSIITLGPAVPNADHVQYAIEKLLQSVGIEGVPIEQSEISYRLT